MFKKRKNTLNFYDDIAGNINIPIEAPKKDLAEQAENYALNREIQQLKNNYEAKIRGLNTTIGDLENEIKEANIGNRNGLQERLDKAINDRNELNELFKVNQDEIIKLNADIVKQNKDIEFFKQGKLQLEKERTEEKKNMQEMKENFTKKMENMLNEVNMLNSQLQNASSGGKDAVLKAQKELDNFYVKKLEENTNENKKIVEENKNIKHELTKLNKLLAEKENAYKQIQNSLSRATILQGKAEDDLKKIIATTKNDKDNKVVQQVKIIEELTNEKDKLVTQLHLLEQENIRLESTVDAADRLKNNADYQLNLIKVELQNVISEKQLLEKDINHYAQNAQEIASKDEQIKNLFLQLETVKQNEAMNQNQMQEKERAMEKLALNNQAELQRELEEKQKLMQAYTKITLELQQKDTKLNSLINENARLNENIARLDEISKITETEKLQLKNQLIMSDSIIKSSKQELGTLKMTLDDDLRREQDTSKKESIRHYIENVDNQSMYLANLQPISTHNKSKIEIEGDIQEMTQTIQTQNNAIKEEIQNVRQSYIDQQPNKNEFYSVAEITIKEFVANIEALLNSKNEIRYIIKDVRNNYYNSQFKRSDFAKAIRAAGFGKHKIAHWFGILARTLIKNTDIGGKPLNIDAIIYNLWKVMGLNIVILFNDHKRNQAFYGKVAIDNEELVHTSTMDIYNRYTSLYSVFTQTIDNYIISFNMQAEGNQMIKDMMSRTFFNSFANDIQSTTKNDTLQQIVIDANKFKNIKDFKFISLPLQWLFTTISPAYLTKFNPEINNTLDIISPYMCFVLYFNRDWKLLSNSANNYVVYLEFQKNQQFVLTKSDQMAFQIFPNTDPNVGNTKISPIKNILKSIEIYSKIYMYISAGGFDSARASIQIDATKIYEYDKYFWNWDYGKKESIHTPSFFRNEIGDQILTMSENIDVVKIKQVSNNANDLNFYTLSILVSFYFFIVAFDSIDISVNSDMLFNDLEFFISKTYNSLNTASDMVAINIKILETMKLIIYSSRYVSYYEIMHTKNIGYSAKGYSKNVWVKKGIISNSYISIWGDKKRFEIPQFSSEMKLNSYNQKWNPYIRMSFGELLVFHYLEDADWNKLKKSFPTNVYDAIMFTTAMGFDHKTIPDYVAKMEQQMDETLNIDIKNLIAYDSSALTERLMIRKGVYIESYPLLFYFANSSRDQETKTVSLLLGLQFLIAKLRVYIADDFEIVINDTEVTIDNLVEDGQEDFEDYNEEEEPAISDIEGGNA